MICWIIPVGIKYEFGLNDVFLTHQEAANKVDEVIRIYNNERPHGNCNYLTPAKAHEKSGILKKRWKPKPPFNYGTDDRF